MDAYTSFVQNNAGPYSKHGVGLAGSINTHSAHVMRRRTPLLTSSALFVCKGMKWAVPKKKPNVCKRIQAIKQLSEKLISQRREASHFGNARKENGIGLSAKT